MNGIPIKWDREADSLLLGGLQTGATQGSSDIEAIRTSGTVESLFKDSPFGENWPGGGSSKSIYASDKKISDGKQQ